MAAFWELTRDPRFLTYHDRVRNYFPLAEIVAAEMSTRTAAEWEQALETADVPFAPVLTPAQAWAHPQIRALGLDDPSLTGGRLPRPLRFDGHRPASHSRSSLP